MQMQMLIDQLKNSVQEKMNEDAGEGYHSCPCCRSVYDTGALSLSLPAPSSSASSFSYLISASSASRPACVSVGTPLWISFSKYLGTNLPPTPSKKKNTVRRKSGKGHSLDAASLTLGRIVPLALLDDVLRACCLAELLTYQLARHALPKPPAFGW